MIWLFVELIDLNSQATVHGVWILDQKWHPQHDLVLTIATTPIMIHKKKKLNSFLENTTDT